MKKLILLLSFLILPSFVWGADPTPPPVFTGGILPGPPTAGNATVSDMGKLKGAAGQDYVTDKLIPGISNGFLIALLSVCVGTLIVAGLYFVLSSGDTEKKQKAKDIVFWAATGGAIAILAIAIVRFVIGLNFG